MNYIVTLDDLIEIEKVYYYDNNGGEQPIELTGDPHYEVTNNTITVISSNEIPVPRIDYKSSKTGINLGTVGAVDINSVTDENENNLEYVVNDDNTLTVSNLNIGDSVRVNYDLERIRIGALEYEDGDKSKNPTKYGMRIRNSQGEDVLTTDDNGDITMTGTIHAYAGDFTGTVNAQAGEFSGNVRVGADDKYVALTTELENGPAIASSDYMNDRNTGWAIIGNGDAYFHNITARGCIRTAVFEYEEINAVGGAFLFRPSSTIRSALLDDDDIIITVEKDNGFNNGDWVKIAGAGSTAASLFGGIYQIEKVYDIYYGDESNEASEPSEVLVPCTYRLLGAAADFSPYVPEQDSGRVSALEGGAFISLCGEPDESSEFYDNYGIGINSGQGQLFMPERAISLFETSVDDSSSSPEVSMAYTGILGTLPKLEFFQTGVDESSQPTYSVDTDIYRNMEKTQGIYTNNMYIGDEDQYVVFYEESNEKVLDIAAGSISVGMGDYDPLYLIGDQYGVALYRGEKADSTQTIQGNNLFIDDESLQLRDGKIPLSIFKNDGIELIGAEANVFINNDNFKIEQQQNAIFNIDYSNKTYIVERTESSVKNYLIPYNGTLSIPIQLKPNDSQIEGELFAIVLGSYYDRSSGILNDGYVLNKNTEWNWSSNDFDFNAVYENGVFTISNSYIGSNELNQESLDIVGTFDVGAWSISQTTIDSFSQEQIFASFIFEDEDFYLLLTKGTPSTVTLVTGKFSVKYDGDRTLRFDNTWARKHQGRGTIYKIKNLYFSYVPDNGLILNQYNFTGEVYYSLPNVLIGYPEILDEDESGVITNYAFALGDGLGPDDRHTAFGIDWDGHLYIGNDMIFTRGTETQFYVKGDGVGAGVEIGTEGTYSTGYINYRFQSLETYNLAVSQTGALSLRQVPWSDVQHGPDWGSATEIWNVDMTKVPQMEYLSTSNSYKNTTTGWEYVGITFTVPSGYLYLAHIYAGWSSGSAGTTGVGFHHMNTLSGNYTNPRHSSTVSTAQDSPLFKLSSGTYYVFVKRGNANVTNTNYVYALKMPIPPTGSL